jgi:hypothetical protein
MFFAAKFHRMSRDIFVEQGNEYQNFYLKKKFFIHFIFLQHVDFLSSECKFFILMKLNVVAGFSDMLRGSNNQV